MVGLSCLSPVASLREHLPEALHVGSAFGRRELRSRQIKPRCLVEVSALVHDISERTQDRPRRSSQVWPGNGSAQALFSLISMPSLALQQR